MFQVLKAWEMEPERDIFISMPSSNGGTDQQNANKQAFFRVPIRSSNVLNADGQATRVQMLPGESNVTMSTSGLRRVLLEFPQAYTPGIKVYAHGGIVDPRVPPARRARGTGPTCSSVSPSTTTAPDPPRRRPA